MAKRVTGAKSFKKPQRERHHAMDMGQRTKRFINSAFQIVSARLDWCFNAVSQRLLIPHFFAFKECECPD
jgi:hypothetical protein